MCVDETFNRPRLGRDREADGMSDPPCPPDRHVWTFTTPLHIRCSKCGAIGQRWPSRAERAEFIRGRWFYLQPKF